MTQKTDLITTFKYAFEGIFFVIKTSRNMKIHITTAVSVLLASYYFKINAFETGLIIIMIVLVIITEILNTAVEEMVNMITKDYKIEAKIAKDVSAGAVLITAIAALIVGIFIFLPYLLTLIK